MSFGAVEPFTAEERSRLAPYFTNVDQPVFALVNLPEVVKGALFARYSRSGKSLRRLFLDEFAELAAAEGGPARDVGLARAERLFERVFVEYGDDSVAQLGGVHLACEGVSNVLTKLLEWGRLMAYLEQSTRYIPYTEQRGGRWRYLVPAELDGHPLRRQYVAALDAAFDVYARWIDPMRAWFASRYPKAAGDSDAVSRLRREYATAPAMPSLRDVQHTVALERGFPNWRGLIARAARPTSPARDAALVALLEAAVEGNVAQLRAVLDEHPDVINVSAHLRPRKSGLSSMPSSD